MEQNGYVFREKLIDGLLELINDEQSRIVGTAIGLSVAQRIWYDEGYSIAFENIYPSIKKDYDLRAVFRKIKEHPSRKKYS